MAARSAGVCEALRTGARGSRDAIADMAVNDSLDMEMPSDHKRIVVDTQTWFASKMRPRVYGDKVEVTGKDSTLIGGAQLAGRASVRNAGLCLIRRPSSTTSSRSRPSIRLLRARCGSC